MATSYPDRTNARGIWKLSDITRNIKTEGTFPASAGVRGIFGGGYDSPALIAAADFVTIATTGNASAFGNLSVSRRHLTGFGSFTRIFFCRGCNSFNG